jgi:hypothetical protein
MKDGTEQLKTERVRQEHKAKMWNKVNEWLGEFD